MQQNCRISLAKHSTANPEILIRRIGLDGFWGCDATWAPFHISLSSTRDNCRLDAGLVRHSAHS
eukprot:scaffold439325_cov20-Prasinocladus_malaysianus.AAC.1